MAGERNVVARNVDKVASVSKAREETDKGCQGQGGDICCGDFIIYVMLHVLGNYISNEGLS